MSTPSTKQLQEQLVIELKKWLSVEGAASRFGEELSRASSHPLIQLVAQIIRDDSRRHAQVQQLLIESLEARSVPISPEDLEQVWGSIEAHLRSEQAMVRNVRASLDMIQGRGMVLQQYLLEYLLFDEEKHDLMLEKLEGIKRGLYPYG